MAPLPKRKHSSRRQGKRRAAKTLTLKTHASFAGEIPLMPHRIDAEGMYKGIQILKPKTKKQPKATA